MKKIWVSEAKVLREMRLTMTVKIRKMRFKGLRFWLMARIISFGAWVGGLGGADIEQERNES